MSQVYNMLSVPFAGVDGGNVPLSALQFSNVVQGDGPMECDFLQIWNGSGGYNIFYQFLDEDEWINAVGDAPMSDKYPDGIPTGSAMWYQAWVSGEREAMPTFTVSGAIVGEVDVKFKLNYTSATMPSVYNMLCNPYPIAWSPNDKTQCEFTNVIQGDGPMNCDFLQVWNGAGGYNIFYQYLDEDEWINAVGDVELSVTYPTGIPAGTAFWYQATTATERSGDLTITFKNPIK